MIEIREEHSGQVARMLLPPVLDIETIDELRRGLHGLARTGLKLVVFEGSGKHFSFGASIPDHLPGKVEAMLPAFHGLFRDLERLGVPTAAVVRGQCLGGGCELALWCGMVFVAPNARLGLPEVTLGVFPPIAALALRWRTGGAMATRLVFTGEVVDGERAVQIGLADHCSADPDGALAEWFATRLLERSAVGVQFAWRAARMPMARSLERDLGALEALYIDDLMRHRDPLEGLHSFLEKRAPDWSHA